MDETTTTELSLEDQIAKLQKDLVTANSSKDYWYNQLSSVQNEINQIQQMLDYLPSAPPRRTDEEYPRDLSVMTRLAIFFASRK